MHLRYYMMTAFMDYGIKEPPYRVMEKLGITYSHVTPQTIAEQVWYWNCKNVPEHLPDYIKELPIEPREAIGFGLSEKLAKEIEEIQNGHHQ